MEILITIWEWIKSIAIPFVSGMAFMILLQLAWIVILECRVHRNTQNRNPGKR